MSYRQYQSIQGPTDASLKHSEIEGYQPVSRIGEVVINSFIDAYEFAALPAHISHEALQGKPPAAETGEPANMYNKDDNIEVKPHFHQWASALPGMVCLSRKARNSTFRNYVAAETATPVIASAACLPLDQEDDFYFAGICRSKSVRPIDDAVGPSVDEFFTLAIGGMVTILNNSSSAIFPGDMLAWSLYNERGNRNTSASARAKADPRRISIKLATATSERVIGRALSFAKPGETLDILIKSC